MAHYYKPGDIQRITIINSYKPKSDSKSKTESNSKSGPESIIDPESKSETEQTPNPNQNYKDKPISNPKKSNKTNLNSRFLCFQHTPLGAIN